MALLKIIDVTHGPQSDFRAGDSAKIPDSRDALAKAICDSIRPCTELSSLGIPARKKVLGDWFMEGDLGFIFAPRGLGKTWLSLLLASSIASGKSCGPWTAHGARKVLYVDGEMPIESIETRIKGMGAVKNLAVLNHEALFHVGGKSLNLADSLTQDVLTSHLLAEGVQVLVLDNLSCLFSGVKENEGDAWEPVKQWFLTLRRNRISVLLVHHAGRNGEMRGTSKREDDVFWIIRLDEASKDQRTGAQFLSRFTKDRNSPGEQAPIEWSFTTLPDGSVRVETREASSLDIFRQWIEDGLTSAEDIAREMSVSKGTISKWARKAIEAGWLVKKGRGYALA